PPRCGRLYGRAFYQDRPVRADLADLLGLRGEGRPQAAPRPRVAMRRMRGVARPGCERGGERREGHRAGGNKLRGAGKTRVRPGAARRSRNPPEVTPGGVTGGNPRPSGRSGSQGRMSSTIDRTSVRVERSTGSRDIRISRSASGTVRSITWWVRSQ